MDSQTAQGDRIASIDALRGFDMFWIIGGGAIFTSFARVWPNPVTQTISEQMEHVRWEGFRFEDLIFPLFLFIVGLVMPFSLLKRLDGGASRLKLYFRVLRRSIVLFLMGLILYGFLAFNLAEQRWMGVLQRIAICYLITAILVMNTKIRTQIVVFVSVLVLYWAAMALVPVPGYGAGVITPAGCLHSYVDQMLLGGRFNEQFYGYGDAEGILSTFPAVCTTLLGVLAGYWLKANAGGGKKALVLAAAGLASLGIGYVWGMVFPIIKMIWTSSYVLVAGGWSLLLLALFYWVIDVKGYRRCAFFFVVIGMNAITIYFLQGFVNFESIAARLVPGVAERSGTAKPVVLPAATVAIEWLFLWFLYRNKIFFKV